MKPLAILALAVLVVAGVLLGRGIASRDQRSPNPAAPAALPRSAIEILDAQPFAVDEPFVHEWRAEKPLVDAGYLLALKVDPDLARARQTYEPVLYVGAQTAESCNAPEEGGILIVVAPAPLVDGSVALDLATTPIWFGSLELPERVDAARIERELASARAAGVGPARMAGDARLRASSEDVIHARTRMELQVYVEDWIARYSR